MKRVDLRAADELRPIKFTPNFMGNAHGSCLVECGRTRVLCSCMLQDGVPPFLVGTGKGWLTAEYAMLPGSTIKRKARDGIKTDGRSVEIRRLIGRSLRTIINFSALGENTPYLDCDVIEADGGTRTASITGSFIALAYAVDKLLNAGVLKQSPVVDYIAAISAGFVNNQPLLDLCYVEDSAAQADMNLVVTGTGDLVEVQCTGEKRAIRMDEFFALLEFGKKGISEIIALQRETIRGLDVVRSERT